jgi:hypothetical protein
MGVIKCGAAILAAFVGSCRLEAGATAHGPCTAFNSHLEADGRVEKRDVGRRKMRAEALRDVNGATGTTENCKMARLVRLRCFATLPSKTPPLRTRPAVAGGVEGQCQGCGSSADLPFISLKRPKNIAPDGSVVQRGPTNVNPEEGLKKVKELVALP